MSLFDRIAAGRRNARRIPPDPATAAGLEAEQRFERRLRARLAGTGCTLHAGRRVPDHINNRRREIDFVVTRPDEVLVLEVKRWSGEVHVRSDGRFEQRRREGGVIDHGRIIDDLVEKGRVLRHLLRARTGQDVTITPRVVFVGDPPSLTGEVDRDVVTSFAAFSAGLPRKARLANTLRALLRRLPIIRRWVGQGVTPGVQALRDTLDRLGTWDRIVLHGGRVLSGDLIADHPHHLLGVPDLGGRDAIAAADVQVPRGALRALLRFRPDTLRLRLRNGEVHTAPLPSTPLRFHEVGQPEPTTGEWHPITRIEVGYTSDSRYVLPWSTLRPGLEVEGVVRRVEADRIRVDIGAPRRGVLHARDLDERPPSPAELRRRFSAGQHVTAVILRADAERGSIELATAPGETRRRGD